jgi:uncharacterized protein (DUF2237 family)
MLDRNVFGEPLVPCSFEPLTGFMRDGCCRSEGSDMGAHLVCAVMTKAFLAFSQQRGNDLSTPRPEWQFPGLMAGDQWCLCLSRWIEAHEAGCAPMVVLESTHQHVLDYVPIEILQQYDHRPNGIGG